MKISKTWGKFLVLWFLINPLSALTGHFQYTIAEKFFKNFPDSIPKASKIDKYEVSEAKYCLVHIRQEHYGEGLSGPEVDRIDNFQENIYHIVDYLIKNNEIKEVRLEGLLLRKNNQQYELENAVIKKYCQDYYASNKEYAGGGVEKLVLEGKINPKSTEDYLLRKKIDEKMDQMGGSESWRYNDLDSYIQYVGDEREDRVLKMIVDDDDRISIIVYGADHAWGGEKSCGKDYLKSNRRSNKDNIDEWNESHPDKKFSLIEILPESKDILWKFEIRKSKK